MATAKKEPAKKPAAKKQAAVAATVSPTQEQEQFATRVRNRTEVDYDVLLAYAVDHDNDFRTRMSEAVDETVAKLRADNVSSMLVDDQAKALKVKAATLKAVRGHDHVRVL